MKIRLTVLAVLVCAFASAEVIWSFGIGINGIEISVRDGYYPVGTIVSAMHNGITYYSERPSFGLNYTITTVDWDTFERTYREGYYIDGNSWRVTLLSAPIVIRPVFPRTLVVPPPPPRHHIHHPHPSFTPHGPFPPSYHDPHGPGPRHRDPHGPRRP